MRRRKRTKDKILHEILSICSNGENYTRIIHRSYTNDSMVRYFIQLLIEKDMLEKIEGSPVIYKTTPKGHEIRKLLKMYQELIIGEFGE